MIYECIGKYSQTAYAIPELSVSVYSFEELAHVLSENIISLGDFVISDDLIIYIRNELDLTDLSEDLERRRKRLAEFVLTILSYRHFMPETKLEKIRGLLSSRDDIREYVRLISRGDFMVENLKLRPALMMYEHARELMDSEDEKDMGQYGDLLIKLGKLYAQFFMFDRARECFDKAGDKRKAFYCMRLSMSRVEYADSLIKERPDEALAGEIEEALKAPVKEIGGIEDKLLAGLKKGAEDDIEDLILVLKTDYRRISQHEFI